MCLYDIQRSSDIATLLVLGATLGLVAPVIVMVYATSRIICVVVRTHRQAALQVSTIGGDNTLSENVPSVTMKSLRSGKNILLMCLAYVALTIPMLIDVSAAMTGREEYLPSWYRFISVWIMLCNSSVNSVIYLVFFRSVRSRTTKMFSQLYDVMKIW